jgi:hypothetical protein
MLFGADVPPAPAVGVRDSKQTAALGILAAFAYAAYERSLSWKVIGEIFEGTARTTGMIMAIVIGAYFLNVVITTIGLPNQIGTLVKSLDLSPLGTLMLIIVFYIILGMFMETLSMMVATVPIIAPILFRRSPRTCEQFASTRKTGTHSLRKSAQAAHKAKISSMADSRSCVSRTRVARICA